MENKEKIEQLGIKYAITHKDVSDKLSEYLVSACFQDGYTQCQEDRKHFLSKKTLDELFDAHDEDDFIQEDSDKKYTKEDMINIVNKSRETGLTAEYLILQLNKQD